MNPVLYLLILIPLLAAAACLLNIAPRRVSVVAAAANLALSLWLLYGYQAASAERFQFVASFEVVQSLDLKMLVGIDGLGLMMVLLATIVTLCAVQVAPKVESGEGGFFACLLLISTGCIGAFISLDLFFFYAFHELALIPTFLLIGIWGHGERVAAAWKITIYLAIGSFVLLLGFIALYLAVPVADRTFDLIKLQSLAAAGKIPVGVQKPIFLLMLVGFGTLISLFPFHTWAPQGYAAAPTPAAMLHAGVLKKFGLFGLLRVAYPLLPAGAAECTHLLIILLLGNILYVGLVTIAQKRLDLTLGYSSVMHMGYIFLGLASMNLIGQTGAALLLFAHGLSVAALFAIMGEIRSRTGTTSFDELGGLARTSPFLSFAFGLAMWAAIGLPGFANFAAELLVFFGAFGPDAIQTKGPVSFAWLQWATVGGLWGVVISTVYMLRAYRRIFFGPLPDALRDQTDAGPGIRWPLALLLAGLLVVGFQPSLLVNLIRPSVLPAVAAKVAQK
jgi:NADH-quinone oxidoreductase subunit M